MSSNSFCSVMAGMNREFLRDYQMGTYILRRLFTVDTGPFWNVYLYPCTFDTG